MNFQDRKLIPSKYIYLFMAFICLLLLFLSVVFGDRISILKTVASAVVTPMQSGINEVGTKIYNNVTDNRTNKALKKENKELLEKLEETQAQLQVYEQESHEWKRVQKLLELEDQYPEYDMIGARVIATDSTNWFYTFIINKGSADKVEVGCNVLAGNGLAGIVTEVGKNYAKVRAIIDDNSSISASVAGTDTLCTVSGDLSLIKDGYIRVGYINKADVIEEGGELVTSHVSDKFLPGLLIGYVSDVKVDANNLTQSAKCIPVVDFRYLSEVMVILTKKEEYEISSPNKTIYDNISNVSSEGSNATSENQTTSQEDMKTEPNPETTTETGSETTTEASSETTTETGTETTTETSSEPENTENPDEQGVE